MESDCSITSHGARPPLHLSRYILISFTLRALSLTQECVHVHTVYITVTMPRSHYIKIYIYERYVAAGFLL